jgi:hypothetical protein
MKTKNKKGFIQTMVFSLSMVGILMLSFNNSYSQSSKGTEFNECTNYEDSCIYIGNTFIKHISERNFEYLSYLFSDNILFRALNPYGLVTLNNPYETAHKFKSWFYCLTPDKCEILDSRTEVLVDCLHIYYKINKTARGKDYNIEQHLYCEVSGGKIQKLSMVCSGFREINK